MNNNDKLHMGKRGCSGSFAEVNKHICHIHKCDCVLSSTAVLPGMQKVCQSWETGASSLESLTEEHQSSEQPQGSEHEWAV